MKRLLSAWYKRKWLFWLSIIAIVIVVGSISKGPKAPTYEAITVAKGTIAETVTANGQVKPKSYAALRFEAPGTIADMAAVVGDRVVKGQYLARLNAGELSQRVAQAQAELKVAEVALANAQQNVSDTGVKNDQALRTAYAEALAGLTDMYNLAQKAHGSFGFFYGSDGRLSSSIEANLFDTAALNAANAIRGIEENAYKVVKTTLEALSEKTTAAQIDTALSAVEKPLLDMQRAVATLFTAVDKLQPVSISATTIDTYRTSVATAQGNINLAVTKETGYARAIADAKINNGLSTNTTSASYKTAQANVETAKAALAVARANLNNAYLYAPISGVIGSKNKNIGESVAVSDQVYYILGDGGLEINANISEVDIAKLAVGNMAKVTLDAYGSDTMFDVKIVAIDPVETVIDSVATYKVTFAFVEKDERVRSGMSANIVVSTKTKENVLIIPLRAVKTVDGKKVVQVKTGEETTQEKVVKLGLRDGSGMVEIVEGLSENDTVIIGTL